nr:hypothetical protein DBT41_10630 [Aerococcus urinae]
MTVREEVFDRLASAQAAGETVQFRVPGTILELICKKDKVEEAITAWSNMSRSERARTFRHVRRSLKKAAHRMLNCTASQREADEAAADGILFIAHELRYGQGERYLTKPTPVSALLEAHIKAKATA